MDKRQRPYTDHTQYESVYEETGVEMKQCRDERASKHMCTQLNRKKHVGMGGKRSYEQQIVFVALTIREAQPPAAIDGNSLQDVIKD